MPCRRSISKDPGSLVGAAFLNGAKVAVAYELLTLASARHSAKYLALHHISIDVKSLAGQPVGLRSILVTVQIEDRLSLKEKRRLEERLRIFQRT